MHERACMHLSKHEARVHSESGRVHLQSAFSAGDVHIKERLADSDGRKCKKINKEEKKNMTSGCFSEVLTFGLQILLACAASV